MRYTLFAGLTQLDPADPLATDNYSFQAVNPDIIDRLLEVGAVTHRHDAHAALADPLDPPIPAEITSGGSIPGGITFEFAYTLIDADRGETLPSPLASVTTQDLIGAPVFAPVGSADYVAGSLGADAYYYGATWVDAGGGETTLGAIEAVDVNPAPNARVLLSGLASGMPAGAIAWRLYRARGGDGFHYIASGATDTLTDDGTLCANCQIFPPQVNTTSRSSSIEVEIPAMPSSAAVGWRLYGRTAAAQWPVNSYLASGVGADTLTFTTFAPTYGRPPSRSLALRGAHMIDPDTELIDWHWKRPVDDPGDLPAVGNASADVRLTEDTGSLYTWLDEAWVPARVPDRRGHTFAIMGAVSVGSGQVGGIPGFFVGLPDGRGGRVGRITEVRHRLGVGSAVVSLRVDGSVPIDFDNTSVVGIGGLRVGDVAVEDGDFVELLVDSVSGSPENLTFSIFIDTG